MTTLTADVPAPSLPVRVAGLLAGEAGGAARLVVAGDLPAPVHEALPPGCATLDAAQARAAIEAVATRRDPHPVTAVLILDGARPGDGTGQRLGTACRRFPGRVVVWQRDEVPDASPDAPRGTSAYTPPLEATHFFAYGFRRLLATEIDGMRHALYEYRLADYKRPPDWLNARFWANPERFGIAD